MPATLSGNTAHTSGEVFDCIARTLGDSGFMVRDSRRDDGFLVMEKKTRRGPKLITGVDTYDHIAASILKPDREVPTTTLRLTVTTIFEDRPLTGAAGQRSENEPSDDLRDQATALIARCAPAR
jgi:hypothetical protein